jgi:hypothetical protein
VWHNCTVLSCREGHWPWSPKSDSSSSWLTHRSLTPYYVYPKFGSGFSIRLWRVSGPSVIGLAGHPSTFGYLFGYWNFGMKRTKLCMQNNTGILQYYSWRNIDDRIFFHYSLAYHGTISFQITSVAMLSTSLSFAPRAGSVVHIWICCWPCSIKIYKTTKTH